VTSARSLRPRTAAATLFAATAVALAGCSGTGFDAQTNQQYQAGVGANLRTGQIQLFNTLAVDNGDGTATLSTVIVNTTDETQKLEAVNATISDSGEPVDFEAAPAIIGPGDSFNTGPAATVMLTGGVVEAGDYVTLTLAFDRAGEVTIEAPVVTRTEMYSEVAKEPGGSGDGEVS
jgi:copper(I)-binding protein